MPDDDVTANRLGYFASFGHFAERCKTLLQPAFLAVAKAFISRSTTPLPGEMSDHMLRDVGIARDDARRTGTSRNEP